MTDVTALGQFYTLYIVYRMYTACIVDVLAIDTAIAQLLVQLNLSARDSKKVEAVLTNRKKVKELHYDMVCLTLSGGVRSTSIGCNEPDLSTGTSGDNT